MAHLAGREAGHNTVLEAQRCIDVIDRPLGTATTGSGKSHHGCLGQLQHKVDVMDHQIQHNGDIIGPIGVGTVAPPLEDHHLLVSNHLGEFTKRGVEPLDMTNLQQTTRCSRGLNQCGGLVLTRRDWLFDQNVYTSTKTSQTHGVVQKGWNSDADGLHLGEHGVVVREPAAAELLCGELSAFSIGVRDPHQIGIPKKTEHPGVVPAHVAVPITPTFTGTMGSGDISTGGWLGEDYRPSFEIIH